MPERNYASPARDAAAAETRANVIAAAAGLLRKAADPGKVSLEAVAKAAGVTRLTVYNQFGSRRGLLEAVFDDIAREGGLHRLAAAMAMPDPRAALDRVVDVFCEFWAHNQALGALHAAAAGDSEFAVALAERNARRRKLVGGLLQRLVEAGELRAADAEEIGDLLFALTSYATYAMLTAQGRKPAAVRRVLKSALAALLAGAGR
ncbi:MAG TPA: TetR/AcrR family transcriptional regulator [Luteimonas sp.]|nr:TetR/AcrR family transcriptional regulator [Luteimonas sp.]